MIEQKLDTILREQAASNQRIMDLERGVSALRESQREILATLGERCGARLTRIESAERTLSDHAAVHQELHGRITRLNGKFATMLGGAGVLGAVAGWLFGKIGGGNP